MNTISALEKQAEPVEAPIMDTRIQYKQKSSQQKTFLPRVIAPSGESRLSISRVLLESVRAQTQAFQPVDLRGFIDTRYPAYSTKITAKRISKELYALRQSGLIAVQQKGRRGHPSTYALMKLDKK